MICTEGMMCLTLKQPGNVPDAPYFDGTLSWLESNHSQDKASGRCRNCRSATRCDYSPTTTSPCSKQLFCTQRRRPNTNHKKTVPITERRLNIQQRQRHEAHHIPDGPKVLLGVVIAQGGEGSVHEVLGNQDIVAKVYHQGKRPPDIEEKLRQMVSRPPGGRAPSAVAWPLARLIADRDGQTHGYLMERAKPGAIPAAVFTSRKLGKQHREISLESRREIQVLMAEIVVKYADTMQELHDYEYAVGDANNKKLLAWPDGRILALDADSFQMPAPVGGVFRCRIGRPEYQPPEILKTMSAPCRIIGCAEGPTGHQAGYGCFDRPPEHDRFSLGVLAYQARCEGRHPYSGRLTSSVQPAQKSPDRTGWDTFRSTATASSTSNPPGNRNWSGKPSRPSSRITSAKRSSTGSA